MANITNPVILDRTGRMIAERLQSVAEALWAEKKPTVERKDVNFYDYDGSRVYSYTRAEFLGLSAMPGNPAHTGLTAQGWNWNLADAQAYVTKYTYLDIGQSYITDDGKTRVYVEIDYTSNLTVNLKYWQSAANGVTIDWGDGETGVFAAAGNAAMAHTYADEGKYVITMTPAEGCTVRLGTNTKDGTTLVGVGGTANMFLYQGNTGRMAGKDVLVGIEIGEGVVGIGGAAFAYATNLRKITIPTNTTTIYAMAFYGCVSLEGIVFPAGMTKVGNMQHGYNYNVGVVSLPASITTIGSSAFRTCSHLQRLCIPEGVTALQNYVCSGMHRAKEIIVPDTVKGAFPHFGFEDCYALAEINVPVGVTSIGDYAFHNCFNLRKCELPEGVTTIGEGAFSSCFGFIDFVIPSTVTKINTFAFGYNDGTHTFRVKATTPPALEPTALTYIYDGATIYVPYSEDHSILAAYKAATGWSSRADSIIEEESA